MIYKDLLFTDDQLYIHKKREIVLRYGRLLFLSGSGKPFPPNKHEQFTHLHKYIQNLILGEIYQISTKREQNRKFKKLFYFMFQKFKNYKDSKIPRFQDSKIPRIQRFQNSRI
jgi:hypothetical protein